MSQINDFLDGNAITDAAQAAQKPQSAIDSFLDATPKRSLWTAINDNVIEVANAAAGNASAVANFVRPGNVASQWIDKNFIEAGQNKQSDVVKAEKARYAQEMEQAQGFGDEVSATLGYVARNPLLAAAQAAGSFAGPGLAVGGARAAAGALGMGAKAATRTGLAAGAGFGMASAGGDAAGTAYELSRQGGATDEQALAAARGASVIPGAIGAAGGLVGAERLVAGAKGFTGGLAARALKTGAVEGAQEALEEGVTQYEGQRAAVPFNPDLDPTKGVAGAATMGAVLGGMTGGGASLLTGQNPPARKPSEDLGLNPDSGPISKVAAAAVDEGRAAAPMQPEQAAQPEDGLSLAPEEQAQPQGPTMEERLAALPEQARAQADQLLREIADERVPVGVKRFRANELQQVLDAYPVPEKTDTITPEERAAMGPIVRGYDPATGEAPGRPLEMEGERYQDGIDFATDEQPSQSAYQDAINRIALESYQTPGQPLAMDQAGRLRDAAREQGIPATIVPHPSGRGFDVQATAVLPEAARQQVAQDPVAAALPYDNSPTGRMVADTQGNARQELRPEAVGREVRWNQELAQMEADVRQSEALGMSNLRERIEAFRQKQAEVAGMARQANPPTKAGAASAANAAMQPKEGQILQNRDRSTPGSIEQMQRIAAAPDYGRLGFSRDFANGAPVVTDANIDPAQLGRADIAVASDGRRIPVQYAVVEADTVLPSNRVDGSPNAEYATAADRMRAIAGNGRIAGLQAAAQRGTNAQYVQELANDTMHGINPQVIAAMRAPVLVRIMPQEQVTDDIGDVSNTTANLQLSAVEQSRNDAQRVDLSVLEFAEDGGVTAKAVRQFVQAMPQAERGALLDVNGQPTKQAVDRLHAAVFSSAYGNDQLVRLYAQAQDPEARLILSALAKLAPKFARLEGAGALDIRPIVTQAAEIAVNARRNGTPLAQAAQQLDIAADPLVGVVLKLFAQNPRSNKLVIEKLGNAVDMAYAEAFKPDADMFGPVPRATREQVMNQLEPQNEPPSTQNLEQPAGREPVPADVIGQATAGAAQPSGAATEAGTAAAAGQQQDAETVAITEEQKTNSKQNESENVVGQAQAATKQSPTDLQEGIAAAQEKAQQGQPTDQSQQAQDGNGAMFSRRAGKHGANSNPDILYSKSGKPVTNPTAVKMRRAMVQRTVDALAKGWAKAPNVTVVDSMQDERVPEAVRKADAAQRSQGAMGEPEGFWYRGQVYLVASALPTSADAARVLYHEVLGHHGLRGHFGKDLDRVLDQVIKLRRKDVQAKAQEYGLDMDNPKHAGYAAEEVLAELAQSRPDLGFVQRAIAAIRNFLRTHIPGFKVLELTDADIVQGYLLPARGWVERGGVQGAVNGDTRFSFAGERANTADTMALATAQQRLDAGEDAEIVRQETGWHKGADDKWRFEISDADAKYIGKDAMEQAAEDDPYKMAEMRLEEVLDHPALFAAYPGLRDVSVAYEASSAADGDLYYGASYNAQDNVITIGNGLDEGAQLSALLHEIQHGIQNIEGFATGGGLETAKADVLEGLRTQLYFWANVYSLRREMDAKGITAQEAAAAEAEFTGEEPNADAVQIASDPELQTAVAEQNMQRLEQEIARIRKKGARGVYEAMAGEVEARNTQARQGMTDAQRRATPPSQTADVADNDVIVAFNGKEADSAPAPANAGVRFSRSGSPDAEVQRQFKETERAYGGKAAYDRAKAAGKTKLTHGQWVQVRTPNFKAWFGDWEAVRAQERLDAMEPVQVRVPDAWRGLGHAELRQKMAEELDRMVREKVEINHPELGMIRVGRAGAKKSQSTSRDPAKVLVAADLENVLPAAFHAISDAPDTKEQGVHGYSTLLARVDVDGSELIASFSVRQQQDGAWYYNTVTLKDVQNKTPVASPRDTPIAGERATSANTGVSKEKAQDSYGSPGALSRPLGETPIAGLSDFIRRPLARVNPEAVSKVVDSATGEPLVVYHGTAADFDAFDNKKTGANDRGLWGRGHYFSAFVDSANSYALRQGDGARIIPSYVSIKNPLVLTTGSDRVTRLPDGRNYRELVGQNLDGAKIKEFALEGGHDGVIQILPNGAIGDLVAYSPEQIKSATGNNGNFDPANPDIRFSRSAAPSLSEVAETGRDTAWTGPAASKWDDFIYKMQDKHIDTKRALEAVRETGKAVSDDLDVYLQEELYHGRAAKRTEDFVKQELEPLLQYMSSAGLKMADVEEYLHARHAKEANAVIAKRNPSLPDGGSGMTNAEADAVLGAYAPMRLKLLEKAAAKVDAIIAGTRNTFVEYGLEGQDVVDGWAQSFAHYVPLMREQEGDGMAGLGTGQGFSVKGREVKGRTGSTKKVVDILANIAMQRERAIVRGEKNRVAAALVGLAKAHPSDFWKVDVVPTRQVLGKDGMVKTEHDPLYKQRDNVVVAKIPELDTKTGKVLVKEHAVLFNENDARALRMAQALKNLDAAQLEGMLGATAKVTRYLAAINTQYNPIFGIVNLVRDVQGAAINLQSTALAGRQGDVLTQTLPALRGIYSEMRSQRKGSTTGTQWSKLWQEFQEVGGQTGYRDQFRTSSDRGQAIERALDPSSWAETNWGRFFTAGGRLKVPLEMARKTMAPVLNWLDDYNTAMENGVRLAAYKAGLDAGLSKERAASIAKNLTTNFNRKGQAAQQIGALYAFFNASVQGTARIGEALFTMEPGQPKTLRMSALGRKVVSGGVLLGAGQALMLAAAGFGDDEPPEHVRERNLVIPLGGKRYATIPLPLGLHVLPNLGRIPTEFALDGFKNPAEQVLKVAGLFADAFNPVGNSGLSMQTLVPTVLDPLAALAENQDFAGRAIAKESFNPITPGHALARDTATAHAKLIAEAVNFLSGGTAHVRGALSPTPDQIDYLIGQFTGGVGRELSKLQQSVVGAAQGDDVPAHKVPVLGRFYGDANSPSAKQAAFYNHLDSIARHAEQVKGLRLEGEAQAANTYLQEHPEARLALAAKATSRAIQKMREQRRELEQQGAAREQVRQIEEQMTARMEQFNAQVERAMQ